MSETPWTPATEWLSLKDAPSYGPINGLIPTRRAFYWELGKPDFKRRLVEAGALVKTGKSWRVSASKAPAAIAEFYREQSLEAIDRGTRCARARRTATGPKSDASC